MIDKIYRDNTKVVIEMDSKLGTCRPIYKWEWNCGSDQEIAELLTRMWNKRLTEFKEEIAKEFWWYLDAYQITAIKRKLNKEWDSKNECWK
jgi:hypothetical protein